MDKEQQENESSWDDVAKSYLNAKESKSMYTIDDFFEIWSRLVEEDCPEKTTWETEGNIPECGGFGKVNRQGRLYFPRNVYCGEWSCPSCGPRKRQRLIDHLSEVTKGQKLYLLKCDEKRWLGIKRMAERRKIKCIGIIDPETTTVILNVRLPGAEIFQPDDLKRFLEAAIPVTVEECPIFVSRDWKPLLPDEDQLPAGYKPVLKTLLPLRVQREIAKSLWATLYNWGGWLAPDVDEREWEKVFTEIVLDYENYIFRESPYDWICIKRAIGKLYDLDIELWGKPNAVS